MRERFVVGKMSSAKERFRKDWEAKFPTDAVPEGLEFLRRPRNLNVLERSLDRCVRRTDELNSQIARQNFISHFILQLMDGAAGQGPGDDEEDDDDAALPADAPHAAAGDDRPGRCCLKDADFSSFELIDLDDARRTCDLDYPSSKKPGTVQTILDKVKGAGVIRTSWEPNISDDHADRHKGKPPKCAPKNPNRIGAAEALAAHTSRHFAGVNNKTSEIGSTAQGGDGAEKSRETEDSGLRKESRMYNHKESAEEQGPSSESILDMTEDSELNKSSDSPQSISKGNRPTRPRRSDLYEEAFPVAKSHLSEHEKAFSDEEHEEESSPLYFNILLFRQQTLDRAKMVYFNDELSSKLEQQARKLSMRCSHSNRRTGWSASSDFMQILLLNCN